MVIVMVHKWYFIKQPSVSYVTVRYVMTNENKMIHYEIRFYWYVMI